MCGVIFVLQCNEQPLLQDVVVCVAEGQKRRSDDRDTVNMSGGKTEQETHV